MRCPLRLPLQLLLLLLLLLLLCLTQPTAAAAAGDNATAEGNHSTHSEAHSVHECVLGALICVHADLKPFLLTALWLLFLLVLLLVFERSEHPQHHPHHQHQLTSDAASTASSDWGPLHKVRRGCNQVLHYFREYVPTSCLQIVLGLLFAGGFQLSGYHITHLETLEPGLFFHFLLPIIIINAGLGVEKRYFYYNLPAILSFAVIGTVIVALVIGYTLWGLASMDPGPFTTLKNLTKVEALTFGALISAVDPVAVLALFERMHLNKPLFMTLFGESVLNDAVSVVLYNMFTQAKASMATNGMDEWHPTTMEIGGTILYSIHVAISGFIIGVACGMFASGLIRILPNAGNQNLAVLIVVISGYISFYLAEIIAASGILSTFVCSIVMSIYLANLTPISYTFLHQSTKSYAEISEGFVYLVMGVSALNLFFGSGSKVVVDVPFVFITLALCILLRFACVYGIGYLLKLGSLTELRASDFFILSYGGLRGAIALALSLMLERTHYAYADQFFACTILMVLLTCFINGITLKPLIQLAKIEIDESVEDSLWDQIMSRTCDYVGFYMGSLTGYQPLMTQVYLGWNRLNDKYIRRGLLKSKVYHEAKDEGIYELHRKIVADEFLKYATENKSLIDLDALRSDSMVYAIRRVSSMGHLPHSQSQRGSMVLPPVVRRALSVGQTLEEMDVEAYQEASDPVLDMEALNANVTKAERDQDDRQNHHRQFMRDSRIISPRSWHDMRSGSAGALSSASAADDAAAGAVGSMATLSTRAGSGSTASEHHHHHRKNHHHQMGANPGVKFSIDAGSREDEEEEEDDDKGSQSGGSESSASAASVVMAAAVADELKAERRPYASKYYAHHSHLIQLPRHSRTTDDASGFGRRFSNTSLQDDGRESSASGSSGAKLSKKKSVSFAALAPDEGVLDPRQRMATLSEAAPGDAGKECQRCSSKGRFQISVCSEEEMHRSRDSMPSRGSFVRIDDNDIYEPGEEFNYEVTILDSLPWNRRESDEHNDEQQNHHHKGKSVKFGGNFYLGENVDDTSV